MKILVFAHTPPPHHGQSYMVKLMLEGLGGDWRQRLAPGGSDAARGVPQKSPDAGIQCFHVNARFSEDLEDIGAFRLEKVLLVLRYCAEAVWCRFRFGIDAFYYVPAPGKRAALYRDWMVMLLCRPFFRNFIHHWHAVGLGDWLQQEGSRFERWLTHRLLGSPSLGIALAIPSMRDALWFRSRHVEIVPNGIPEPCPDFETSLLPRRTKRLAARRKLIAGKSLSRPEREKAGGDPEVFRILYLAHCIAEKGLFDTVDAVALANSHLRSQRSPVRLNLTVAGEFLHEREEHDFRVRLGAEDIAQAVTSAGFVSGHEKAALLRESDCLCFPTYYPAEGQPVNLIEAMAYGLLIVTTRWRAIPEILPAEYSGFVAPRKPAELAVKLQEVMTADSAGLRAQFLALFTEEMHLRRLTQALESATNPPLRAA